MGATKVLLTLLICNLFVFSRSGEFLTFRVAKTFRGAPPAPPPPLPPLQRDGGGKTTMAASAPVTADGSGARRNTLMDDADDLQRQLDNEARDRFQTPRPKPLWVFHMPAKPVPHPMRARRYPLVQVAPLRQANLFGDYMATKECEQTTKAPEWYYSNQNAWCLKYPTCGGRWQSPVSVGVGMVRVRTVRPLCFKNYDVLPLTMTLRNDGKKLTLSGNWSRERWPSLWGGAVHSRRYVFHSLELHWPSEHRVGYDQYPMELQATHVAAEYSDIEAAQQAGEPEALLKLAYLFQYDNVSEPKSIEKLLVTALLAQQEGEPLLVGAVREPADVTASVPRGYGATVELEDYFREQPRSAAARGARGGAGRRARAGDVRQTADEVMPLNEILREFTRDYATYAGSLTAPPCLEVVRWIIYSKALSIRREVMEAAHGLHSVDGDMKANSRPPQPLNDRRIYYFF